MTWSGVTARTAATPSGLPGENRDGARPPSLLGWRGPARDPSSVPQNILGWYRGEQSTQPVSVPLLFLKEPTHYAALWTSRTLNVTR